MKKDDLLVAFVKGWESHRDHQDSMMPLSVALEIYKQELRAAPKRTRRWAKKPKNESATGCNPEKSLDS